ncbi:amidase signature enzyme [Penicillium verhagenii]|uniref:amidase signature enzyme n=1 Tax=Penicillium verhagenii TaxID=1562060 RepID=UPI0025450420|nr:amidase signature enzyme [Penicillium verhagenii]KAJ5921256.1 amidase signature enzyme [Penicillium verhagenii]
MPSFPHAWKAGSPPPGVGSSSRSIPLFNALTATAHELQALMISGTLKSTDLVEEYIWRIENHNSYLNAIFEYSPTAMQRAADMDSARQNGEFLGPLHGIPIVLKDNMATDDSLGMNTTAGASSLWGSTPSKNAAIVNRFRTEDTDRLWGGGGGGSWSDLRVGTLDVESWLYPDVLVKSSTPEATEQMIRETREAYCRIAKLAGSYHENVDLRSAADFVMDDGTHSISAIFHVEFKDDLANYLSTLKNSNIRSLQEMVDWNSANPSEGLPEEYPSQSSLITSLTTNYSDEKVESIQKHYREVGSSFEDTLKKYDIDVIIGPGDSFFTTFAAANGCPVAAMPLSSLDFNGRPFGLMAMARPHEEALLLRVMSAFESSFSSRQIPKAFLSPGSSIMDLKSKVNVQCLGTHKTFE